MSHEDIPFDLVCGTSQTAPEDKAEQEKFRRFLEYVRVRPTDRFVFPPEILTVDEITVATIGNFSASVGKPKSRKTFNVSAIVAAIISGREVLHYRAKLPAGRTKVLYIDTEQSRVHCQKVLRRILRLAGLPENEETDSLEFLMLREFTPQQRRGIIDLALEMEPSVGFMVIDGVRDLLSDINSPGESIGIINDLMRWTNKYDIHIHTVLHLNKSDDNTRGHIGTELNNKAETVIKVTKSELDPDVSEVCPMITREKEFERFAFRINGEGLPEASQPADGAKAAKASLGTLTEDDHRMALDAVFADGPVTGHSRLVKLMSERYADIGLRRCRTSMVLLVKMLTEKRVIRKDGRSYAYEPENIKLLNAKP